MVREVQSSIVEKSVAVIDLVARASGSLSYSEIVRGTGINKSSTHRVLSILVGQQLIQFDEREKSYGLGPKLVAWARAAWQKTDLEQISDQDLVELSDSTGMNVAVSVLNDQTITFIRTRIIHRHKLSPRIGGQSDLHCTAAGKVFLAYMDKPALKAYLINADLEKYTETTLTSKKSLQKDLSTIVDRGYAIADREELWQVVGIAAPIVSYDKRAVAALGLWSPTKAASLNDLLAQAPKLMVAASAISARFGFMVQ